MKAILPFLPDGRMSLYPIRYQTVSTVLRDVDVEVFYSSASRHQSLEQEVSTVVMIFCCAIIAHFLAATPEFGI